MTASNSIDIRHINLKLLFIIIVQKEINKYTINET